jgi:hypothetical protein
LNARQSIRGKNEEGVSINLSELRSGTGTFPNTSGFSQTSPGGIHKVRDIAAFILSKARLTYWQKQLGIREVSEVEVTIFHLSSIEEDISTYYLFLHSSPTEKQNLRLCGLCPYSHPKPEEAVYISSPMSLCVNVPFVVA